MYGGSGYGADSSQSMSILQKVKRGLSKANELVAILQSDQAILDAAV